MSGDESDSQTESESESPVASTGTGQSVKRAERLRSESEPRSY